MWVSGREWSWEDHNAPYDDTPHFPNIRRCSDPWALDQNRHTSSALSGRKHHRKSHLFPIYDGASEPTAQCEVVRSARIRIQDDGSAANGKSGVCKESESEDILPGNETAAGICQCASLQSVPYHSGRTNKWIGSNRPDGVKGYGTGIVCPGDYVSNFQSYAPGDTGYLQPG